IHVGIHERFADSVAYFARVLGRPFTARDFPSLNVGTKMPATDPAVEMEFLQRNQLDLELYEFASRLFETRTSALAGHDHTVSGVSKQKAVVWRFPFLAAK